MGIGLKCEPKTLLDTFPSFDSPCSAPGSRRIRKRKTRRTQTAPGFRCAGDTREYHSTARGERILNIKRFIDRARLKKARQKERERENEASDGSKVMAQSAKELFSHRLTRKLIPSCHSIRPSVSQPSRKKPAFTRVVYTFMEFLSGFPRYNSFHLQWRENAWEREVGWAKERERESSHNFIYQFNTSFIFWNIITRKSREY